MTTTDRRAYKAAHRAKQKAAGVTRMTITLTAAEADRLKASAKRHRARPTSHLKACALSGMDARYLVPPDTKERLDALLAVMRGIGNNLNQLARYSNEMRYFLDTEEVRLNLKRMDEEVRRFVAEPVLVKEEGPNGTAP